MPNGILIKTGVARKKEIVGYRILVQNCPGFQFLLRFCRLQCMRLTGHDVEVRDWFFSFLIFLLKFYVFKNKG